MTAPEVQPDVPVEWQFRMTLMGLDAMHGWRGWKWQRETDPFDVVIGSILVQHTAWTNVERALANLDAAGIHDAETLAATDDATLEEILRPAGSIRRKVQTIRAVLALARCHGGLRALLSGPLEDVREQLLALPGIGEETADTILVYGGWQPVFIIDAYTRRVYSRMGMGPGEDAPNADWKAFFDALTEHDADLYGHMHALIVNHAKHLCRARSPRCNHCVLQHRCTIAPENLERIYARARAHRP